MPKRPNSSAYDMLAKYTRALAVALGHRHLYTRLHSERVHDLSVELGISCGLSTDTLKLVGVAARFHDVGKLGIPDSILSKEGRLDELERQSIRRHPVFGEEILAAMGLPGSEDVAQIIRHHHEYFNGAGYPDGLSGEDIPIASRIIGIVDSYDAMGEQRPYHRPRPHCEIVQILEEESATKHDPELLKTFLALIERSQRINH